MSQARFSWRALALALGAGLVLEAGLLRLWIGGALNHAPLWGWVLFRVTQEPGGLLVGWLLAVRHPGFEEQTGYLYIIPLIQWVFYSGILFLIVQWRIIKRTSSAADAPTG